ncbi:anacyclamide/piricyclamide family prenylated cyclic peptide [Streptosporangium carneum]|uniref:Uncharacterized protein n=1 Tax=Streptosporangium carneum TaxID=47481 RepID=A0A9W6HXE9_9ACTN|nr:anacyclamide/piricyclamide family prenylated cyclic peptide [Streptosporangium carneum]GLK08071.1 hypothetical protein GCM10017600_14760 [Streptosporangium carneum]
MNTTSTMPHQSTPVERAITGTGAIDSTGVTPSLSGIPELIQLLPFAGDDDD